MKTYNLTYCGCRWTERSITQLRCAGIGSKDQINAMAAGAMDDLGVDASDKSSIEFDPREEPGGFNATNYRNFINGVAKRGKEIQVHNEENHTKEPLLTDEQAAGLQEIELASRVG